MRRKPKSNLKNGRCKKRKQGREKEGRVLKLSTNKSNKELTYYLGERIEVVGRGWGGGCARGEAEWSNLLASRSTRFVSWCWASALTVQSGLEFPCAHDHRRRSAGLQHTLTSSLCSSARGPLTILLIGLVAGYLACLGRNIRP